MNRLCGTVRLTLIAASMCCVTTPPAAAADKAVRVYEPGQSGVMFSGLGLWDDSQDSLCASLTDNQKHSKVVVRISPRDGSGPTFRVVDTTPYWVADRACTGNLSIQEDERYRIRATVHEKDGDTWSASSRFRT